jgi:hypothetical protein
MRRSWLLLCLLVACDSRPEAAFCREARTCEHTELLLSTDVCADLVSSALARQATGCQRCATSLRCEAIESVLTGKRKLRDICSTCNEELEVPVADGAPRVLLTSAIAYRADDAAVATVERDELGEQAAAICKHGEGCEGVMLLVTPAECEVQVAGRLASRELACRRCASALSCAGARSVVEGQQSLSSLCSACGDAFDPRGVARTPGPGGPHLLIPAIVAPPGAAAADVAATPAADASESQAAAVRPKTDPLADARAQPGADDLGDDLRLKAPARVPPLPRTKPP